MKFHRTKEEEQAIQNNDEERILRLFDELGYEIQKLDLGNLATNPDFRLTKGDETVIVELKSRFEENTYDLIATLFTDKLDKLQFGFSYNFRHFYSEMPESSDIKLKIETIKNELSALPQNIDFPYSLKLKNLAYERIKNKDMKMNPERSRFIKTQIEKYYARTGDGDLSITLSKRNDTGHLRCNVLIGDNRDDLLVKNKLYFSRSIKMAKRQLHSYIGKSVLGVVFVNHTKFGWNDHDIISLYGDLKVAFSVDPDKSVATPFLGENRIIREDRKQWLSFIGFIQPELTDDIKIYKNGFAEDIMSDDFFGPSEFTVKTISISDDGSGIIIK